MSAMVTQMYPAISPVCIFEWIKKELILAICRFPAALLPCHCKSVTTAIRISTQLRSYWAVWAFSLSSGGHESETLLQKTYIYATFLLRLLQFNPLNPELNPICYLLALLGAHHFLHVSRIRVKSLNFRLLMSYIYGAPILDVSRSHTTTQHSR